MKNTILLITLIFSISAFSQKSYETYTGGDIDIDVENGEVYVEIEDIGLVLTRKARNEYVEFLKECLVKGAEWDSIAISNNIDDMELKFYGELELEGYFEYGGWRFGTTHAKLVFVRGDGETNLYMYYSEMVASDNQFMESEAGLLTLNEDLLKDLESKLSDENIDAFVKSNNDKNDLFK